MENFVHLHVHSHYSLLDGGAKATSLVAAAADRGMEALALTDHGNLFGAIEFYLAAHKAGIKPILGLEAYISPTTRTDRTMGNIQTATYHLLLLAANNTGWRNLIKLSSRAYLEGFYYRPRIDRELLSELNEGLICTSACLGGEIPSALLAGQDKRARQIAGEYLDIFGPERFFIEVQSQGIADQDTVNPMLIKLAGELGVGVVGTNDVHFLSRDDKRAHEVLTCISTGKTLAGGGVIEYSPELYLKSPAEMRDALKDLPSAADTTLKIAEMCDVKLDFTQAHLPVFHTPDGESADDYLHARGQAGRLGRFAGDVDARYSRRWEWDLKETREKGYSSYFLFVNYFVQYARRNSIPAAPRGSGVATLLGYALGLADVDPLRYGLLFERFTDPQREEAPDLDIDICQEGRAKVIQYVRQKYGHVAQVITYGTLKARAVIRDVGRVMDIPLIEVDAIAKKVPETLGIKLADALEVEPDLRKLRDNDPRVRELMEHGMKLEGLARHAGIHAAAVIIAEEPLENLVPLCRQSDSEDPITQWDGPTCEKVGLMKMDFLGLRTLTILQRTREMVHQLSGEDIDPEKLDLDDSKVFELFCRGETDGVFQFESDGMKNVLLQMQPAKIDDLIAANAMYRPGPMELIPSYCARKNAVESVPSVHPLVDDILSETYGIMVFQEQVMQVLNRLGKLPLNRALTLIKAISKKKAEAIASERPNFFAGAKDNGISDNDATRLFDLIMKFAGYGFNKAHSTRYAILAYQMAYFKVYHPREFLAATLTCECSDTDKVVRYMAEAKRMGVPIAPPDINTCRKHFVVDGERVRFGLAAVKGVGAKAVDAIVEAREQVETFKNLHHFCENVDLRAVNRSTIEALIKCGAFDSLGAHRAAMIAALENAVKLGQTQGAARRRGQMSIFDVMDESEQQAVAPRFPDVPPWSEAQLLAAEKETIGFYVSSHPLVRYGRELTSLSQPEKISLAALEDYPDAARVTIGCMIASIRPTVTKTGRSAGKKMAMLTLEDLTGKADAVVFSEAYEQFAEMITDQNIVFVAGKVDRRRERPSIIVDEITPIDQALEKLTGAILLHLPPSACNAELLDKLKQLLAANKGNAAIYLQMAPASHPDISATIRADKDWSVAPNRELVDALVELLDEANVRLRPRPQSNGNGRSNKRGFYARAASNARPGPASPAVTRFN